MDLKLGSDIAVEIVAEPRNEAARKTLVRICRKDRSVVAHDRRQHEKRPSFQTWRRGGMTWKHRMKTVPAVALKKGQTYSVKATLDVVRDLESVKRWVKVKPA